MMHLDVFIPESNLTFEYQGRQHFEPIEYFGGKESFEVLKRRDDEKAKLCKKHGVKLLYIREGDDFSESTLRIMLKEHLK